jgi:glycosyl transferase family 87
VTPSLRTEEQPGRTFRHFLGVTSGWRRLLEIEDRIFTEPNLQFYGFGVAWAWALFVGWLLLGGWIIGRDGMLRSVDFCWIWVSGQFAASNNPAEIYNPASFTAAQDALFGTGECSFLHFSYPPTLLFFTYPVGLLPYTIAFVAWNVATLVLYLAAVYAIIPRSAAVIVALTPMAVALNVVSGHNGFLTAGLLGLSLIFVERRPWLSGFLFGLLSYKPQFGVLFPLALLVSRNWRALCCATASIVVLSAAAAAAFGYQGWPSFIDLLWHRNSSLSPDGDVELKLQSVYGLLHWADAGAWLSWTVHLTVAVVVVIAVCFAWVNPIPYSLKAAILGIGAVTATPYVLQYDLCIVSIPVAFLIKDGMSRGFLPGERIAILVCVAGLLLWFVQMPISPVVYAVILLLIARRIAMCRRGGLALETVNREGDDRGKSMLNPKFTLKVLNLRL